MVIQDNFNKLNGNIPELKKINSNHSEYTLFIPLQFWFVNILVYLFPLFVWKKILLK